MESSQLPDDPVIRRLVIQARQALLTRRSLLAGAGASVAALLLAACTPDGVITKPTAAKDLSATHHTLTWANWQAYLDQDGNGGHPSLEAFEKQSGITVTYDATVDDDDTYYAGVKDRLALGKDIGADTVCLADWMVARLIRLGYVQSLDAAKIPNLKNLAPALKGVDFDPGRTRSIPWQSGFTGICWNKAELPKGLTRVSELWNPSLRGKIGVLSSMRDTMGLIMLDQGVDISRAFTNDQYMNSIDRLTEEVGTGQIHNIKGGSYLDDLKSGDTIAAICWSNDITLLNAEAGDNWEFALPEAGGVLWSDDFVVPIGSSRRSNVEDLIDYYYEPAVAAEVAAWVNYATPVVGARQEAVKIDPRLAENQLIFPDEAFMENARIFRTLTAAEEQSYQTAFQNVVLGT